MKSISIFLIACLGVISSQAYCQMTEHPNVIGVYFDEGATANYMEMSTPIEDATAYLVLTYPEFDSLDHFFALCYLDGQVYSCDLVLPEGGVFVGSWYGIGGEIEIEFPTPYPTSTVTVLATIANIQAGDSVCFMLEDSVYALDEEDYWPLQTSTHGVNDPATVASALINDNGSTTCTLADIAVVPVVGMTFTEIKGMFED